LKAVPLATISVLTTILPQPGFAQMGRTPSEWIKVGEIPMPPTYGANIMARQTGWQYDENTESKEVSFELNIVGKTVGAMEFMVICKNKYFIWEAKIPTPYTGIRVFHETNMPFMQKAKRVAANKYCRH